MIEHNVSIPALAQTTQDSFGIRNFLWLSSSLGFYERFRSPGKGGRTGPLNMSLTDAQFRAVKVGLP